MSNASGTISIDQAWDILTEQCGVSEQTLIVVTSINGWQLDTLESVLFVVTGYRSFDQLTEND